MNLDLPGFADPVTDSQLCFRAVLNAISYPGRICQAGNGLAAPPPLDPATAAVILTLADAQTSLALPPEADTCRDWIAFHCGAPFAAPIDAVLVVALTLPDLLALPLGSDEAPERSATVILQVRALGSGIALRLQGPGLRTTGILRVDGLPDEFPMIWAANHARFPRGVDLILCAGTALAALPRSLSLERA